MLGFRAVVGIGSTVLVAATSLAIILAGHFLSPGRTPAAGAAVHVQRARPPQAPSVASDLAGVVNAQASAAHGARIGRVSCIAGGGGTYVCSYVRTTASKQTSCAVALLRWTPTGPSTYTVQTAGRVALAPRDCGPVTKVLHVVGTSG